MQKSIQLNQKNIEYTLNISNKARSLRLAVYCDGRCVVTTPRFIPQFIVDRFLINKSEWILNKIEYFIKYKGIISTHKKGTRGEYIKNKDLAYKIAKDRLEYYNKFYGYKWNNIIIKNQKTRWGSCSKKGNLNFNYKIVLLPEKARDYIIVHELCHLGEFNHSRNFWKLVAKTIPNYLEIRKNLRKNIITRL